jgi:hypothetical protein
MPLMASTNKCLAQSNKSGTDGNATKNKVTGSAAQFRVLAKLANGSALPAIS